MNPGPIHILYSNYAINYKVAKKCFSFSFGHVLSHLGHKMGQHFSCCPLKNHGMKGD